MKKSRKIGLIAAIVLMVVGAGISVITFAASGFDPEKFQPGHAPEEQSVDISGEAIDTLVVSYLDFDASYGLEIVPSEDGDFHVTYASRTDETLVTDVKDGALRLSCAETSDWRRHIGFGWRVNVSERSPVQIAVPASVATVDLRETADIITCENLNLSGDLLFYCSAVDLRVRDCSVAGELRVEGDAGDVTAEGVSAGTFTAKIDASLLSLDNVSGDVFELRADYGDIRFSELSVGKSLAVIADWGDVKGTVVGKSSDFTIHSKTDFGDNNLSPLRGDGAKTLIIRTDGGDVDISFLGDEDGSGAIVFNGDDGDEDEDDFDIE